MVVITKSGTPTKEPFSDITLKNKRDPEPNIDETQLKKTHKKLSRIVGNKRADTIRQLYSMGCYLSGFEWRCLASNDRTDPPIQKENS